MAASGPPGVSHYWYLTYLTPFRQSCLELMQYYTLIASLPPLPVHFDVERTPVSRPRLRQVLKQLSEEDAETVDQLSNFLSWDRQLVEQSDEDIRRRYEVLMQNRHPLIRELVNHRINVRTIVAALRRRRDGLGPPTAVGMLVEPIRRNWSDPTFLLGRRYPWIEPFSDHLLAGETGKAERTLFEFTWRTWSQLAQRFTFSFEAVPLYVARWEIVDRWTSRDRSTGEQRFEQLTQEVLGKYATLQF